MDKRILVVFFAAVVSVSYGFSLREIWDFLLGVGYGYPNYQGGYNNYPSGPGLYPGNQYPGYEQYPGSNYNPGLAGPPGAHPGCPLCDSSVYSYCYRKQAHDACCCDQTGYLSFGCRKTDCNFLHANSCQEYRLISDCCCVDLQKNSVDVPLPVVG